MPLGYAHLRRRLRLSESRGLGPLKNRQTAQFPRLHRPNLPCHGISWPEGRANAALSAKGPAAEASQ